MIDGNQIDTFLIAGATALAGLALGLVYFRALRRSVDLFANGHGWAGALGLTLFRIAAAVVVLTLMARLGALPLLAGLLGFLGARTIALHAVRRSS